MRLFLFVIIITLFSCKKNDESLYNEWNLISYVKGPGEVITNSGFRIKINFYQNENFTVKMNTNMCQGNFSAGVREFNVINLSCDTFCCDSNLSVEAINLIKDSVETYNINGKTLKLYGGNFTKLEFTIAEL